MRDPATGKRVDPRIGRQMEVGTATIKSVSANLIFKKAPVKSEIAMEVIMPNAEGRKMQAFYGRDPDGSWRGRVTDIGQAGTSEVSPYAFIRVMDDEEISLRDVEEMTAEMAENYEGAIDQDLYAYEEGGDLYQLAKRRMEQLLEAQREARKNFDEGMKLLFGPGWKELAADLMPERKF